MHSTMRNPNGRPKYSNRFNPIVEPTAEAPNTGRRGGRARPKVATVAPPASMNAHRRAEASLPALADSVTLEPPLPLVVAPTDPDDCQPVLSPAVDDDYDHLDEPAVRIAPYYPDYVGNMDAEDIAYRRRNFWHLWNEEYWDNFQAKVDEQTAISWSGRGGRLQLLLPEKPGLTLQQRKEAIQIARIKLPAERLEEFLLEARNLYPEAFLP